MDSPGSVGVLAPFAYARSPELFGTRRGTGPLRVVWDTDVLLEGPGMHGWLVTLRRSRDVRFYVPARVLADAERLARAHVDWAARADALARFVQALQPEPVLTAGRFRPTDDQQALDTVAHHVDRALLAGALDLGAHVFLTSVPSLVARRDDFRPLGLWIGTGDELFERLLEL
jgi:hypothetical protein